MRKRGKRPGNGHSGWLVTREAYKKYSWRYIQYAKEYKKCISLQDMMKKITTVIRPKLKYAGVIGSPHKK